MSATDIVNAPSVVRCTPQQAAKTYAYLEQFVDFDRNPRATLSVVFARSCLATHPDFGLDLQATAREASEVARRTLAHPDHARLDLDPLLLVTMFGAFIDAGCDLPPLRDLASQAARELAPLDAKTRSLGRVRLIASVLAAQGFEVAVASRPGEVSASVAEPSSLLNASSAVLGDVADHLLADGRVLDPDLTTMLALTALGELRNYRIDLGAKLLRLVVSHGVPRVEAEEGLNFVALQRRRNGAYGFLNPFAAEEERQDLDNGFFIPMTLNAAWLLRVEAASRVRARAATG